MKCKTLENIRHNFFFTSGLQGNLNGKYKIIPSDGKKESNEERADTTVADLAILFFTEWEPPAAKKVPMILSASEFRGEIFLAPKEISE